MDDYRRRERNQAPRSPIRGSNIKDRREDWFQGGVSAPFRGSESPPHGHEQRLHRRSFSPGHTDCASRRDGHGKKQQLPREFPTLLPHPRHISTFKDKSYELPPKYRVLDNHHQSEAIRQPALTFNPSKTIQGDEFYRRRGNDGPSPSTIQGDEFYRRRGNDVPSPSTIQGDEFYHRRGNDAPSPSSGHRTHGMPVSQSAFIDDGPELRIDAPPSEVDYPRHSGYLNTLRSAGGVLEMGKRPIHGLPYLDCPRSPFDEKNKEMTYSRDMSFPMRPPTQKWPFTGSPSASLPRDEFVGHYEDSSSHRKPDEYIRGGHSKPLDTSMGRHAGDSVQFYDEVRRPTCSSVIEQTRHYAYHVEDHRERKHYELCDTDGMYDDVAMDTRRNYRDMSGSPELDFFEERAAVTYPSFWTSDENRFRGQYRDIEASAVSRKDYIKVSGRDHYELGLRFSGDHENPSFDSVCDTVQNRGRFRNSSLMEHHEDVYRHNKVPPCEKHFLADIDVCDPPYERMMKSKHIMKGDLRESSSTIMFSNYSNAYRNSRSQNGNNELQVHVNNVGMASSKGSAFRQVDVKKVGMVASKGSAFRQDDFQKFGMVASKGSAFRHTKRQIDPHWVPDDWSQSYGSSEQAICTRGLSLKKRLRPSTSDFYQSSYSNRSQEHVHLNKNWNRVQGVESDGGAPPDEKSLPLKTDPPEGSVDFMKQVHKAFLRFVKLLNESPRHLKRYQDQGKSNDLLCYVCGSNSKVFADTHGLLSHAYQCLKSGSRIEHLGLHKAICLLLGLNWQVPPKIDNKAGGLPPEAKALRDDLILWPPIVIIHDLCSAENNDNKAAKLVTTDTIVQILKEKDVDVGKTKVCRGKSSKHGVFLVKFNATHSGLQEAERLHKHYADNNLGRQELDDHLKKEAGAKNTDIPLPAVASASAVVQPEELQYGYIAMPEDLDKLDAETKRRCVVKSKTDIEAIVDATLNID